MHYFNVIRQHLESWFAECPYRMGLNWSSALEAAIRLINWSVTWQLLGAARSPLFEDAESARLRQRWLESIYQHAQFVRGYFSRHSSANNHLVGEAAGLFIAALTWPCWPRARVWLAEAKAILEREILLQNTPDGVNREQAVSYHQFELDLLVLAFLAGKANGQKFSAAFESRIEAMMEYLASIMDAGGNVCMFGDSDDSLVVRLAQGGEYCRYRSSLAVGAILFLRGDFKGKAGGLDDKTRWLFGEDADAVFQGLDDKGAQLPVRRAFAEGGYGGTPVADALPVVLEAKAPESLSRLHVTPTRAGEGHAVTQIAKTEQDSVKRWSELPEVVSVNPIHQLKPGATELLRGVDESRRESVVLAYQRYGRGKTLALPVYDTGVAWQLNAKIPVEDMTHETLWRQLLRWLVDGVPNRVELTSSPDQVEPGEKVTLSVEVADPSFVEVNDAGVNAHVNGPNGTMLDVPLQWTGERNGEYRGSFSPTEPGLYEVKADATRTSKSLGTSVGHVRVAPSDSEYFDAAMRAPLLRRISDETGGRFYTPQTVASLPDDVKYTGRGVTTVEERDLWDMPIILFLLLTLLLGEWSYRRIRHLA